MTARPKVTVDLLERAGGEGRRASADDTRDVVLAVEALAREALGDRGGAAGRLTAGRVVPVEIPSDDPSPDSPEKFLVLDSSGSGVAFAFVSSPVAPRMTERNASATARARRLLGDDLGEAVLGPLCEGDYRGRSIALFPVCRPLARPHWLWPLQRPMVRRWAIEWIGRVALRTVHAPQSADEVDLRFGQPLAHLASLEGVVPEVRRGAALALERLRAGHWRPAYVLMHGDLWKGNILVRKRPTTVNGFVPWRRQLVVIDWATTEADGYPMFDLTRLAESLMLGAGGLRGEVARHCAILACEPVDALGYVLAALGHRAANFEYFTMAQFARMARVTYGLLAEALDHGEFGRAW